MGKGARNVRYAEVDRETTKTKVHLVLDLDGGTRCDVATGVTTFDEMLQEIAGYAAIDLGVSVEADVGVHGHAVMEDVGTAFGTALASALEDSDAVVGTGSCGVPSADALVLCAMDLRSRSFIGWDVPFRRDWIAEMNTENVREFFEALVHGGGCSLHLRKMAGENDWHMCEAVFRSFGRSLHIATRMADRGNG